MKAHPRVHQLGFLLLCISVPPLCVTDQIPLEGELHYLVPLVIKIILNPVQLLVSGIISLIDALMHAALACIFPSGHPSLPAWIVNSEKSLAQGEGALRSLLGEHSYSSGISPKDVQVGVESIPVSEGVSRKGIYPLVLVACS